LVSKYITWYSRHTSTLFWSQIVELLDPILPSFLQNLLWYVGMMLMFLDIYNFTYIIYFYSMFRFTCACLRERLFQICMDSLMWQIWTSNYWMLHHVFLYVFLYSPHLTLISLYFICYMYQLEGECCCELDMLRDIFFLLSSM
jgi:hypothetical protein